MDMGEYIHEKFGNDYTKIYEYFKLYGLGELGEDGCIAGQLHTQHTAILRLRAKIEQLESDFRKVCDDKQDMQWKLTEIIKIVRSE